METYRKIFENFCVASHLGLTVHSLYETFENGAWKLQ